MKTKQYSSHRRLAMWGSLIAAAIMLLGNYHKAQAQWTTAQNGNDVYKTNTAGNVGIGTTAPGEKLDVTGAGVSIGGTGAVNTAFLQDHTNYRGIYLGHDTAGQVGIIAASTPSAASSLAFWTYSGSAWAEKMRIDGAGNVGIGTMTPSDPLQLDSSAGWALRIRYTGDGQYLRFSANQISAFTSAGVGKDLYLNTAGGNVGIGTTTPGSQYKLDVAGNINSSATITGINIAAKYQDVAEWVPSSEQMPTGTVVVLDTTKSNQVISSSQAYDTRVAGVISEQPGIALGEGGNNKVLVATTGRVLVKVDASRTAVHIGDLLVTSNVHGAAMKSEPINIGGVQLHRPGTLIGKALEPLEKGSGRILVLLSLQ